MISHSSTAEPSIERTDTTDRPDRLDRDQEPFPDHYNDLAATLKTAWQMMGRGVHDRRAAFHTPMLATHSAAGPQARVLVLRAFDAQSRVLTFHTDTRSDKFTELGLDPRAALTFYDAARKTQIRCMGKVMLHNQDAASQQAWAAARPSSLRCYLGAHPGRPVAAPTSGLPADVQGNEPTAAQLLPGRDVFAVLRITIERLEWLYLHTRGQRRAAFAWQGDECSMQWLNP